MLKKTSERISRTLTTIIKTFSLLKKAEGTKFALKGCICVVMDTISRQKNMLFINLMREYFISYFSEDILLYKSKEIENTNKKKCEEESFFKIPIWVCWFQGEDNMPELVKRCLNSVKNNIPNDNVEVNVVSLKNYMDFVEIPEIIIEKVNCGKFSLTNLSDILRFMLLRKYGGFWIDATVYVASPIPKFIFDRPFYSQKTDNIFYQIRYVSENRWSSWLMYVKKNSMIFDFCTELLLQYAIREDYFIDYFLIDYLIEIAYNEFPEIRSEIDNIEYNNQRAFELVNILNKKENLDELNELFETTIFHKLTLHKKFYCRNLEGDKTNYDYLLGN